MDKMRRFKDAYLAERAQEPLRILDIGSQDVNGSYRPIFDSPHWHYVGVDMVPGRNVDLVLTDPYHWKDISTGSVDVLITGQAFEHIEYFWITILEVSRVLKTDGLACIIVPSGGVEHRYPVDCWRFYPDGMSAMARYAQLEAVHVSAQWEDLGYPDGSDMWHDVMLVCRKPRFSPWVSLKARLKRSIQHRALTIGL